MQLGRGSPSSEQAKIKYTHVGRQVNDDTAYTVPITVILEVHFILRGSPGLCERMTKDTHASWTRHMLVVKLEH